VKDWVEKKIKRHMQRAIVGGGPAGNADASASLR
jgi:hypothetical protein